MIFIRITYLFITNVYYFLISYSTATLKFFIQQLFHYISQKNITLKDISIFLLKIIRKTTHIDNKGKVLLN